MKIVEPLEDGRRERSENGESKGKMAKGEGSIMRPNKTNREYPPSQMGKKAEAATGRSQEVEIKREKIQQVSVGQSVICETGSRGERIS